MTHMVKVFTSRLGDAASMTNNQQSIGQ